MTEQANTFLAGPASGQAAPPEYRRQVTADMPLYDATTWAEYAPAVPVLPRTYASRLSESISVKDFGATGDGITPDHEAIQEAINFAIRNGIATVHFPDGKYVVSDTIHLGYGETFHQINLVGQRSAAHTVIFLDGVHSGGVTLLPTMTDRPCLNIQGGRNCGVYGISFHYEPMWRGIYNTINGKDQNFPSEPTAWNVKMGKDADNKDVIVPIEHGLDRYRAFCAISIDAFRRPRTHVPITTPSYGPVDYPEWTGLQDCEKPILPSSRCTIEDCDIRGFCVGIITEPCGGDENGDFVKIRNCNIGSGVYGITICHTQSRAVEVRNCNFALLHTCLDNSTFGLGAGHLGGSMELCTVGMSYEVLNIGSAAYAGDFTVRNLHVESTVRIGVFSGGYSTWQSGLVLEACSFNFHAATGQDNGPAEIPRAYLEVRGPAPIKFSHCNLICNRFFYVSTGSVVLFENCRWGCGRDYFANNQSHGAEADPAIAIGYSIFGGMHVLNDSSTCGPRIIGQCETTKFSYVPGDAVNGKPQLVPSSRFLQSACLGAPSAALSLVHPAAESYRDNEGRKWPFLHNRPPVPLPLGLEPSDPSYQWGAFAKDPVQSGMAIDGELRGQWQEKSQLYATMDPGDILEHDGTRNIYIVTSVVPVTIDSPTTYKFTAIQQNNYVIKANTANPTGAATPLVPLVAMKGQSLRLHKAIKLPYKVYFGDFLKDSTLVTNVHLGNGWSSQIQNDIPNGMAIAEDVFRSTSGDYAVPSNGNVRIASTTPGNDHEVPGQAILTRASGFTGRLPLFPVMLAGINVRNPGPGPKATGSFNCSTLDPVTKIANNKVTKMSRIILMAANSNAAKLMGSNQALFVSDKLERIGFSVSTGDGKPSAYNSAAFDYIIDS